MTIKNVYLYCDRFSELFDRGVREMIELSPITGLRPVMETPDGKRVLDMGDLEKAQKAFPWLKIQPVFWPQPWANHDYIEWVWEVSFRTDGTVHDIEHQCLKEDDRRAMAHTLFHLPVDVITTHQGHPEHRTSHYMRLYPAEIQALSTASAVSKWGPLAKPGASQKRAVEQGRSLTGRMPEVTLPLYGQSDFEGVTPRQSLTKAVETCRDLGVETISWWSLKHLVRHRYAERFLLDTLPGLLGK